MTFKVTYKGPTRLKSKYHFSKIPQIPDLGARLSDASNVHDVTGKMVAIVAFFVPFSLAFHDIILLLVFERNIFVSLDFNLFDISHVQDS